MGNNRMRTSQLNFHSSTEGLLHNGNRSAVLVTALNPVTSSFSGCSSHSWGVLPDWGLQIGSKGLNWKRQSLGDVPWFRGLIN